MNGKKNNTLREKMREDLCFRNYALNSQKMYVLHVSYFAKYIGKSPAQCGEAEIRKYLHHLREEKKSCY